MVSLSALWLPVLLSAVIVFVASSIIHMVLSYHKNDVRAVPREEEVMTALRPFKIPPGDYAMPRPASMKDMGTPAFKEKMTKGPVAFMTVLPSGPFETGKQLGQWFVYLVVISFFAAYVASRALPAGSDYLAVFRFAGTTAFIGYAMAMPQQSIWYRRNWGTTLLLMFDGLLFGLLTGGTFGWLWPR
jgi:hypothetical protein